MGRVMIEKIEDFIMKVCLVLCALMLITITIFALVQVFGRYVFHSTIYWIEEVTGIILGWMFALGAPMVWIRKDHIKMDAIDRFLSSKVKKVWDIVIDLIAGLIGLVFFCGGTRALKLNTGYSISMLKYDESLRYYFVPVFGLLLALVACLSLAKGIRDFRKEEEKKV